MNASLVRLPDSHPPHHFTATSVMMLQRALSTPALLPLVRVEADWYGYEAALRDEL